jgi:hypothetical protein
MSKQEREEELKTCFTQGLSHAQIEAAELMKRASESDISESESVGSLKRQKLG